MGMDKLSLFAVLFALAGIVMIFALSNGIGGNEIVGNGAGSNTLAGSGAAGAGSTAGSGGCGGGAGCGGAGSNAGSGGCGGGSGGCGSAVGTGCGCGGAGSGVNSAGSNARSGTAGNNGAGGSGSGIGTGTGAGSGSVQDVYIKALGNGRYDKEEVRVKAGSPVRFHFSAEPNAGCGKLVLMEEFGVRLVSYSGEEKTAEFTPEQKGTYEYHCGMHMFVGRMIVE